jgi:hypothetical protein
VTFTLLPDDPDPVTLRRYFPAAVELPAVDLAPIPPATELSPALVIVTRVRAYVFTSPGTSLSWPVDPDASSLLQEWEMRAAPAVLVAPDAGRILVWRARGCGCGNPLKGYQPWLPVQMAAR